MLFADRASDLEWIAEWVSVNRFRAVVVGAAEGWRVADLLAKAGIAVIVDPLLFRGRSFDQLQARPDNAALLVEAGVPVILGSFSTQRPKSSASRRECDSGRNGTSGCDARADENSSHRLRTEDLEAPRHLGWSPLNYPLEPWRCGLMASGFRFPPGRQSFGTAISSALGSRRTSRENFIEIGWRKCTGIEPARDTFQCPSSGFEDQASHQTRPISTSEHTLPVDPRQSVELFDCYS